MFDDVKNWFGKIGRFLSFIGGGSSKKSDDLSSKMTNTHKRAFPDPINSEAFSEASKAMPGQGVAPESTPAVTENEPAGEIKKTESAKQAETASPAKVQEATKGVGASREATAESDRRSVPFKSTNGDMSQAPVSQSPYSNVFAKPLVMDTIRSDLTTVKPAAATGKAPDLAPQTAPARPPAAPQVQAPQTAPARPPAAPQVQAPQAAPARPPAAPQVQAPQAAPARPPAAPQVQAPQTAPAPAGKAPDVAPQTAPAPAGKAPDVAPQTAPARPPAAPQVQAPQTAPAPAGKAPDVAPQTAPARPPAAPQVQAPQTAPARPPAAPQVQAPQTAPARPPAATQVQAPQTAPAPAGKAPDVAPQTAPARPPAAPQVQAPQAAPAAPQMTPSSGIPSIADIVERTVTGSISRNKAPAEIKGQTVPPPGTPTASSTAAKPEVATKGSTADTETKKADPQPTTKSVPAPAAAGKARAPDGKAPDVTPQAFGKDSTTAVAAHESATARPPQVPDKVSTFTRRNGTADALDKNGDPIKGGVRVKEVQPRTPATAVAAPGNAPAQPPAPAGKAPDVTPQAAPGNAPAQPPQVPDKVSTFTRRNGIAEALDKNGDPIKGGVKVIPVPSKVQAASSTPAVKTVPDTAEDKTQSVTKSDTPAQTTGSDKTPAAKTGTEKVEPLTPFPRLPPVEHTRHAARPTGNVTAGSKYTDTRQASTGSTSQASSEEKAQLSAQVQGLSGQIKDTDRRIGGTAAGLSLMDTQSKAAELARTAGKEPDSAVQQRQTALATSATLLENTVMREGAEAKTYLGVLAQQGVLDTELQSKKDAKGNQLSKDQIGAITERKAEVEKSLEGMQKATPELNSTTAVDRLHASEALTEKKALEPKLRAAESRQDDIGKQEKTLERQTAADQQAVAGRQQAAQGLQKTMTGDRSDYRSTMKGLAAIGAGASAAWVMDKMAGDTRDQLTTAIQKGPQSKEFQSAVKGFQAQSKSRDVSTTDNYDASVALNVPGSFQNALSGGSTVPVQEAQDRGQPRQTSNGTGRDPDPGFTSPGSGKDIDSGMTRPDRGGNSDRGFTAPGDGKSVARGMVRPKKPTAEEIINSSPETSRQFVTQQSEQSRQDVVNGVEADRQTALHGMTSLPDTPAAGKSISRQSVRGLTTAPGGRSVRDDTRDPGGHSVKDDTTRPGGRSVREDTMHAPPDMGESVKSMTTHSKYDKDTVKTVSGEAEAGRGQGGGSLFGGGGGGQSSAGRSIGDMGNGVIGTIQQQVAAQGLLIEALQTMLGVKRTR